MFRSFWFEEVTKILTSKVVLTFLCRLTNHSIVLTFELATECFSSLFLTLMITDYTIHYSRIQISLSSKQSISKIYYNCMFIGIQPDNFLGNLTKILLVTFMSGNGTFLFSPWNSLKAGFLEYFSVLSANEISCIALSEQRTRGPISCNNSRPVQPRYIQTLESIHWTRQNTVLSLA